MQSAVVKPCRRVEGTIAVPGDKSISHRAAMLAAIASGASTIKGYLRAEDCLNTLKAVNALGAEVAFVGDKIIVAGGKWRAPAGPLDLGNSGTGIRLLAGLLAGRPWTTELTGDESLRSRPMGRIREPLEKMGARLELTGKKGCAPLKITGGKLKAIEYVLPVASAQVKSCVLLAALFAEGVTTVREPAPTRDHTERMFQRMGIPLEIAGLNISLRGFGQKGPKLEPLNCSVPGDFSSAAFWLAAACARPGSRVVISNAGLNPKRTALLNVLKRMGAEISARDEKKSDALEPCGTLVAGGGPLKATTVGGDEVPNVIDELPLVAILGALAGGTTVISGAKELRVKESDRIACMAGNLRILGVEVIEKEDGMSVRGGSRIRGNVVMESKGDHRLAMAMAILALAADGPVTIRNIGCVATSYPAFWDHLRSIGAEVRICQ